MKQKRKPNRGEVEMDHLHLYLPVRLTNLVREISVREGKSFSWIVEEIFEETIDKPNFLKKKGWTFDESRKDV